MQPSHLIVYDNDTNLSVFLFHYLAPTEGGREAKFIPRFMLMAPTGKLTVRPEYQDLACPRCKLKVDEFRALERGLSPEIKVRSRRDLLAAEDGPYIISTRMRDLLEEWVPGQVQYFPIPSVPRYVVAVPKCMITPQRGDPAFRFAGQLCPSCGRETEVVWNVVVRSRGRETEVVWQHGPPSFPEATAIGAFRMESDNRADHIWFVSYELAKKLASAKPRLTGFYFDNPNTMHWVPFSKLI